jgi:acetyl esterase/lipase
VAANVPASFGSYTRRTDIAYGPDPRHKLDVYLPDTHAGPTGPQDQDGRSSSRPVVVFFFGGRWETGDKSEYRFVGAALAGLGYTVVLPNYRLYPEVKMPGFMDDAARATVWAFEHCAELGGDPARFHVMGHSAGAHLAALVTLDRRYLEATGRPLPAIAGVIGLSGPYDFLPLKEPDLEDMFGPPPLYPKSQPIDFVHADAPPMLLVHGLDDNTVWPKNSINLAAALRSNRVPVTLKLYPKLKHADTVAALSIPARGRAPTLADIDAFVSRPPSS